MDEDKKIHNNEESVAPLSDDSSDSSSHLDELKRQRDEYLAGWQRAKADFINYKKEEAERVGNLIKFANEDLIAELLTVLDNFDLAIVALEKNGSVDRGVYMIRSQFMDIMKRRGLEKLLIEVGKSFDPKISEAITEIESDLPEGTVVEEIKSGYSLYGKIIRPAVVKISRGPIGNK